MRRPPLILVAHEPVIPIEDDLGIPLDQAGGRAARVALVDPFRQGLAVVAVNETAAAVHDGYDLVGAVVHAGDAGLLALRRQVERPLGLRDVHVQARVLRAGGADGLVEGRGDVLPRRALVVLLARINHKVLVRHGVLLVRVAAAAELRHRARR